MALKAVVINIYYAITFTTESFVAFHLFMGYFVNVFLISLSKLIRTQIL